MYTGLPTYRHQVRANLGSCHQACNRAGLHARKQRCIRHNRFLRRSFNTAFDSHDTPESSSDMGHWPNSTQSSVDHGRLGDSCEQAVSSSTDTDTTQDLAVTAADKDKAELLSHEEGFNHPKISPSAASTVAESVLNLPHREASSGSCIPITPHGSSDASESLRGASAHSHVHLMPAEKILAGSQECSAGSRQCNLAGSHDSSVGISSHDSSAGISSHDRSAGIRSHDSQAGSRGYGSSATTSSYDSLAGSSNHDDSAGSSHDTLAGTSTHDILAGSSYYSSPGSSIHNTASNSHGNALGSSHDSPFSSTPCMKASYCPQGVAPDQSFPCAKIGECVVLDSFDSLDIPARGTPELVDLVAGQFYDHMKEPSGQHAVIQPLLAFDMDIDTADGLHPDTLPPPDLPPASTTHQLPDAVAAVLSEGDMQTVADQQGSRSGNPDQTTSSTLVAEILKAAVVLGVAALYHEAGGQVEERAEDDEDDVHGINDGVDVDGLGVPGKGLPPTSEEGGSTDGIEVVAAARHLPQGRAMSPVVNTPRTSVDKKPAALGSTDNQNIPIQAMLEELALIHGRYAQADRRLDGIEQQVVDLTKQFRSIQAQFAAQDPTAGTMHMQPQKTLHGKVPTASELLKEKQQVGLFDINKLQSRVTEIMNSGYFESVKQLRESLMLQEWELTLKHQSQLKGVSAFERYCGENNIEVEDTIMTALYDNPDNLQVVPAGRLRLLARSMINQAVDERLVAVYKECTQAARDMAKLSAPGITGDNGLLGIVKQLVPFKLPFFK